MGSIAIATMGKFVGPAADKFVLNPPPQQEVKQIEFPSATINNIKIKTSNIEVKSINYDEESS